MDIERNESGITVRLEKRERFVTRLRNAPGNLRIKVDEITIEPANRTNGVRDMPDMFTVRGGIKNLLIGYSKDPEQRAAEGGWTGPEPYSRDMSDETFAALQALTDEVRAQE